LGIFIAFTLSSVVHHLSSERRQRFVKQAFSRYVSPNLVSHIVDHPQELELGGRRQECSFIFTDLAGFTSLMEKIDPGEAVALLNAYLDEMISIAFQHNGTLDRIVGDAVAIMFSAPVQQPDHRQRALTCAIAMQRFAARYADDLQARGIAFGQTRIGVHTGEVIVGNFGGSTIFDYRALGDPVNTASRLESVNKHLGTRMCVSQATLSGCTGIVTRPVGRLVLKGKSQPLMVFQPIHDGLEVPGAPAQDPEYAAAYVLLTQDPVAAMAAFRQLARTRPADPLVKLHLQRLQEKQTDDLIVMTEK
jgi:adenylate cyclase